MSSFKVGDKVCKQGGDYRYDGIVVAAFSKAKNPNEIRYVVEDDKGTLHIFNDKNLQSRPLEFKNVLDYVMDQNVTIYDEDCLGKDEISERLELLFDQYAARKYCVKVLYAFALDDEHNEYVKNEKMHLPSGATKWCVARLSNDTYVLGAY